MRNSVFLLEQVLARAKSLGASDAEAVLRYSDHSGIDYSDGAIENATLAQTSRLGIRLIKNQRQGFASFVLPSNRSPEYWVDEVFSRLAVLPEDQTCGLADTDELYTGSSFCDVRDTVRWTRQEMTDMAAELWHQVKAVSGHSSGASADQILTRRVSLSSNGFFSDYQESHFQRYVSAIAGSAPNMEEDYAGESRLYAEDIASITDIATEAADRAMAAMRPQSVPSGQAEVIFEPRVATGLVRQFLSAINGARALRGTSFLADKIGQDIAHKEFSLSDDPFRYRCFSAAPFDAEGLPRQVHHHFKFGKLQKFIVDLASSRGLGLPPQGQAMRVGLDRPPAPGVAHAMVENGSCSVEEMMADIDEGLFVTKMIGSGLNTVTGGFSCGVAGFRIEKGHRTTPFRNVTVAGNGLDILKQLRPATDQRVIGTMEVPSLYLGSLMVGG